MQQMNSGDGDTSRNVDLDEVKVLLRDELDKLPAKYRLPLILHYFGGLKPEEIVPSLGASRARWACGCIAGESCWRRTSPGAA